MVGVERCWWGGVVLIKAGGGVGWGVVGVWQEGVGWGGGWGGRK